MALPNWVKGARRPPMIITWYREDSTTPEDLTGATLTGFIRLKASGTAVAIAGSLTVTDGPNGIFRWDLDADDVAQEGSFDVQFDAAFGSGATPAKTFVTAWHIKHSLG